MPDDDGVVIPFSGQSGERAMPGKSGLSSIDIAPWRDAPVPEPDYAVHNRIPRRQVTLFSGEGAAGKSTVMLHECAAHTLGRDWLGTMPAPGPALFIDAEDDEDTLHRRLDAIRRHYRVEYDDFVGGGLNLVSLAGKDAVMAVA